LIDVRYHIYSLAAVFFALALGIVIGTSFAKRSPSTGSERRTILSYENSMRVLKREVENAHEGVTRQEQLVQCGEEFGRAVLPSLVKDKLAWRSVAIVQTGDYNDLTGTVKSALELAGARVATVTDISRDFPFDDYGKVSMALRNCGVIPPDDSKKAREKLFNVLAEALRAGKYSYLISKLEASGVAKFTGDYNQFSRLRLVVLVGGAATDRANSADQVDSELLARLARPDVTVVGCETRGAASSYVPAWHKMGIATVDNADSAIGQVALIYALNGENAKFGIKETADRLIPQALETE